MKFLGSLVSEKGIEPDPDKLTAISEWPEPKNLTEVRAFVGLASYYRRHVEGFSNIAKPLSELTKKNQPFQWGPEQQSAFDKLKFCLTHYPVLAPPLPEGRYIIDTDASDFAMGAVLQQEQHENRPGDRLCQQDFRCSGTNVLYDPEENWPRSSMHSRCSDITWLVGYPSCYELIMER